MNRETLSRLSKDDLIALVLAQADVIARQAAQIELLTKRVEALEAKLGKPPKTPDNSSLPPSQAQKPNRAARRAGGKRKGHPGAFRALSENPDRVVETRADACPHCAQALRHLPVLAARVQRTGSRRHGAGLAVRPWLGGAGSASAHHPGHQL